jgi:hypothetical protein
MKRQHRHPSHRWRALFFAFALAFAATSISWLAFSANFRFLVSRHHRRQKEKKINIQPMRTLQLLLVFLIHGVLVACLIILTNLPLLFFEFECAPLFFFFHNH